MRLGRFGLVWLVSLGLGVGAVQAQSGSGGSNGKWSTGECQSDGDHHWGWGSSEQVCQARETVLPASARIKVQGTNGNIDVVGEDRTNISLEARVTTSGSSKSDAEEMQHKVKIVTEGIGTDDLRVHEDGPKVSTWFSHSGYSVSYRLRVPKKESVQLETANGSITLKSVSGTLRVETVNGGLTLEHLGGDLRAETVNGSISLALDGERWQGGEVKASTTNGAIHVTAPTGYSAHLKASTVNGGISVDFPVTVQGTIKNSLDSNIGQGGPTIELETVNGGVRISH